MDPATIGLRTPIADVNVIIKSPAMSAPPNAALIRIMQITLICTLYAAVGFEPTTVQNESLFESRSSVGLFWLFEVNRGVVTAGYGA